MATNDISKIVKNLIKKHKTKDVCKLAKCLGISVVFRDMKPITKGIFMQHIREKRIVINSILDEISQRIVLAHEIGHAVLHSGEVFYFIREYTLFPTGKFEVQANKFAAELLLDDSERELFLEYGYIGVAKRLGVPEELVLYKFCR